MVVVASLHCWKQAWTQLAVHCLQQQRWSQHLCSRQTAMYVYHPLVELAEKVVGDQVRKT